MRTAPLAVRAANVLLGTAAGLGVLVAAYAAWARLTVPAGVGALVDSLTRDDRWVLRDSWVLHPDRPIPLVGNLAALIWLGLGYLLLVPVAFFLGRGYPPARMAAFAAGGVLVVLSALATVADETFHDRSGNPDPDRLSPRAHAAWLDLFPPGYGGIHLVALVGMMAGVFLACALLDRPAASAFFRAGAQPRRRRTVRAAAPRLRRGFPR